MTSLAARRWADDASGPGGDQLAGLGPDQRLELGHVGLDDDGLGQLALERPARLPAPAGDAEDGRTAAVDPALFDQLSGTGKGDAAGGLGEDPLGLAQELHGVDDRVVVHVLGPAASLADELRGEVAIG